MNAPAAPIAVPSLSILAGLLAMAMLPVRADDPPRPPSEKPAEAVSLQKQVQDDFQSDTRKDYEVQGNVAWQAGQLGLSEGSSLSRTLDAGPWAEVQLALEWPDLAKDGDEATTLLRFRMNGATDCFVGWQWTRKEGRTSGVLAILDSSVKDGETKLQPVREFRIASEPGEWRVDYRYGRFLVHRGDELLAAAHILNVDAGVAAAAVIQRQRASNISRLTVSTSPTTRPPAEGQREMAEAFALDKQTFGLTLQGKFVDALNSALKANAIRRRILGEQHTSFGTDLDLVGSIYQKLGEYSQAEQLHAQARSIQRRVLGEWHPAYARSLSNLGSLYDVLGEYAKAEPLFIEAREISRTVQGAEHSGYGNSLNKLAELYRSMGEFAKAEPLYAEAVQIYRTALGEQDPRHAQSLENLASLYLAMGEHGRAEPLLKKSCEILKEFYRGNHPDYADSLSGLAELCRLSDDLVQAESLHEQARDIRRKLLGEQHSAYAASLNNLALVHQNQRQFDRAEPLHTQAHEVWARVFGEDHPLSIASLDNLAGLHIVKGDFAQAAPLFRQVLGARVAFAERTAAHFGDARTRAMFQEAIESLDPLLSALRHVDGASADAAWGDVWKSRSLAARALRGRRRLAADDTDAAALLSRLRETQQQLAAWTYRNSDPRERQVRQQRLQQLDSEKERLESELAKQSAEFLQRQQIADLRAAELPGRLPADTAVVQFLNVRVWERSPDGVVPAKPARHYEAFVLTNRTRERDRAAKAEIAWLHLGPAAPIDAAVNAWLADLRAAGAPAGPSKRSDGDSPRAVLRAKLWDKIEPSLDGRKTVILIPDGDLHFLPWGALPRKTAGHYLVEEYSLATAIDGPQVSATLSVPPLEGSSPALLAGGVDYDADLDLPPARTPVFTADSREASLAPQTRAPLIGARRPAWKRLDGATEEIERIAGLAGTSRPVVRLTGSAATETSLREAFPRSRFIHLATHGFFADEKFRSAFQHDEAAEQLFGAGTDLTTRKLAGVTYRNPLLLSGIVLAGANRPPQLDTLGLETGQDGILTAEEVVNLDLRTTELVVLSACETGLGRVAGGEGVFGLQRAFTLAGARTTIASLWKVDDAATQALMTEFYRNLWEKKLGKLESLRQAQIAMLRRYVPKDGSLRAIDPNDTVTTKPATPSSKSSSSATPFHWAAFTLSGDWR